MNIGANPINVVVDNLLAHYLADGPEAAPVVLMLHGWGASAQNFAGLAAHLAPNFRVIRLDLPGFGGTELPPAAWHITDYAQFVAAFLRKLNLPHPPYIIAHSFGGRITLKAVGEGIIAPKHIILMGSAGVRHSQTARNQVYKLIAKTGKAVTALPGLRGLQGKLRAKLYQSAGSTDYLTAGSLRQIFLNTINEDLQETAARITVPTLLIWGQHDREAPVADGQLLASRISGATLHIIPEAGHFVFNDAPEAVYRLVDKALAQV